MEIHQGSRGTYGVPRIHAELAADGVRVRSQAGLAAHAPGRVFRRHRHVVLADQSAAHEMRDAIIDSGHLRIDDIQDELCMWYSLSLSEYDLSSLLSTGRSRSPVWSDRGFGTVRTGCMAQSGRGAGARTGYAIH